MVGVTLADDERRDQLRVRVQSDKRPDITIRAAAVGILALRADETPNLINLHVATIQAAHFLVHDFSARIADATVQTHYRVLVHAGNAFRGADTIAFGEQGNDRHFLFGCEFASACLK